MNCCICGPVKNCAIYLKKVFENIETIGKMFDDYKVILFYDNSTDNTLSILKKYQEKNHKVLLYINKMPVSKYRTHNIANARNFCINYVRQNREKFPYFIMMDMDDPNCKNIHIDVLKKYLNRDDWDALSFNTAPKYYDIWGLSIFPFCFSYNHFNNNFQYYHIIQKYVMDRLNRLKNGELLSCISAFNGFAIYKTDKFMDNTYYDGRVRLELFPKHFIAAHMLAQKSSIKFKNYGNVNGYYEDCEHRVFHVLAAKNNGAKIMISPEILFS